MTYAMPNSPYLDRPLRTQNQARREALPKQTTGERIVWTDRLGRFPVSGQRIFEATISRPMPSGEVMWTIARPTDYAPTASGFEQGTHAAMKAAERACRENAA